jgi:hypothetical protein
MSLAVVVWLVRAAATPRVAVAAVAVAEARVEARAEVASMVEPAVIVRMTASRVVSAGYRGVSTIIRRHVTRFRM